MTILNLHIANSTLATAIKEQLTGIPGVTVEVMDSLSDSSTASTPTWVEEARLRVADTHAATLTEEEARAITKSVFAQYAQ